MMGRQIRVVVSTQVLQLLEDGTQVNRWPVSTAAFGVGSRPNSNQTPLGLHRIYEKIGDGMPRGAVFVGRRYTGIIWNGEPTEEDGVLTRILRLEGLDPGNLTSLERCIYIHGTNREADIGRPLPVFQRAAAWVRGQPTWHPEPRSHGCVRMRNLDVMDLYDRVAVGDEVLIVETL